MALAVLRYLEETGNGPVFRADIGSNEYYQYRIGEAKRKYKGLEFVDKVSFKSELIKAERKYEDIKTDFLFKVSRQLLQGKERFIQLYSYRDQSGKSPAISEVANVAPNLSDIGPIDELPMMMTEIDENNVRMRIEVEDSPFSMQNARRSESMFFNAILGSLPGLLTSALPAIGKMVPGLGKAMPVIDKILPQIGNLAPKAASPVSTPAGGGSGGDVLQQLLGGISPDTIKALMAVIGNLGADSKTSTAQSTEHNSSDFSIEPNTLLQLAPIVEKWLTPEAVKAIGDNPKKLFMAIVDSARKFQTLDNKSTAIGGAAKKGITKSAPPSTYSEAKIAPALLAALPALLPLIEKALNPETIKAIGDQPVKLINAVADVGLKHTKQELDHLEKINPGIDTTSVETILNSLSLNPPVSAHKKDQFSPEVVIDVVAVETVNVGGKDKTVYSSGSTIIIPIQLGAGGNKYSDKEVIPKGIFKLAIQDGSTMKNLLEKEFKITDVPLRVPIQNIQISQDELQSLPLHKDLKAEITFRWQEGGQSMATFKNHYLQITDGYIFQRLGDGVVQSFELNQVDRHREFWHKIWEGGPSTHERWEIDIDCRYFYALSSSPQIKRNETRRKLVSDTHGEEDDSKHRRKVALMLKSGMEVSLEAYNELLQQLDQPPLDEMQISSLRSESFEKRSGQVGTIGAELKGRKGERSSLWVYPEGEVLPLELSRVTQSNEIGLVTSTVDEEVLFPRFTSMHFIGTRSE